MKKIGKKLLGLGLTFTLAVGILAGCGSTGKEAKNDNTQAGTEKTAQSGSADKVIRVGASVSPHAEILEQVKPILEKEGYTLDIVEYNDYVLPNTALNDGDLDANYFQHQPYLTNFNEENGTDLVSAGSIHFEPLGIYSEKLKNLNDNHKKYHSNEHHIRLISIISIVDGDCSKSSATDKSCHCRISKDRCNSDCTSNDQRRLCLRKQHLGYDLPVR